MLDGKNRMHLTFAIMRLQIFNMNYWQSKLPSMKQRISDAYNNTREFVNFINKTLPEAKINFVSEELAKQGFTPSVFSLDLPTKGNTDKKRSI